MVVRICEIPFIAVLTDFHSYDRLPGSDVGVTCLS